MKAVTIHRLTLLLVLVMGCEVPTDRNQRSDETENTLQQLVHAVVALVDDGTDVASFRTLDAMLAAADKKKLVEGQVKHLQFDAWERPLKWTVQTLPDQACKILIISAGRNGAQEGNTGDDIFVEIEVVGGHPPKVRHSWPDQQGAQKGT